MVPQRVSLVTIGAIHLPELRSFYQKLGWSETAISSDQYSVFETTGVLLSLYPIRELEKDTGMTFNASGGLKGTLLAINVDKAEDVDDTIGKIREAGGNVIREPYDAAWGGRIAYFLDPENNCWEVTWNPTAVFDEKGAMIIF
ncbi:MULTISPECIES: VOC family protein [unclassified Paenibacillus]|uniref:VOC family protein n=1 Tax=unclassified Paenibacillus TaxID=185978 RepID=UPI00040100C2|nr:MULTISPECIES: VOC family protein [unclassified Paenibacillus]KGP85500.1 glyoxalase [Paenibacillus sp. MAEPY2]KGP87281.1 glyoxalase [Paenibacillus sp. MAEPY1]